MAANQNRTDKDKRNEGFESHGTSGAGSTTSTLMDQAKNVASTVTDKAKQAGLDIASCAVREVKGYSRQKSYLERYAGSEYSMAFLPKVEITLGVPADRVEAAAELIARAARTGRMGDGKVFVVPLAWPEAIEF